MNNLILKSKTHLFSIFGLLSALLFPQYAFAEGGKVMTTLQTIFENGQDAWVQIIIFLGAAMFVTGVVLGGVAIGKFKGVADGKVSMTQPIVITLVSAGLIASPSVIMMIAETYYEKQVWRPTALLSAIPQTSSMAPGVAEALTSVLIFVQLLGVVAFFRGMLMFRAIGANGNNNGGFGKAMTHVLGGVLAINIQLTVGILARTFFAGADLPMGMENW